MSTYKSFGTTSTGGATTTSLHYHDVVAASKGSSSGNGSSVDGTTGAGISHGSQSPPVTRQHLEFYNRSLAAAFANSSSSGGGGGGGGGDGFTTATTGTSAPRQHQPWPTTLAGTTSSGITPGHATTFDHSRPAQPAPRASGGTRPWSSASNGTGDNGADGGGSNGDNVSLGHSATPSMATSFNCGTTTAALQPQPQQQQQQQQQQWFGGHGDGVAPTSVGAIDTSSLHVALPLQSQLQPQHLHHQHLVFQLPQQQQQQQQQQQLALLPTSNNTAVAHGPIHSAPSTSLFQFSCPPVQHAAQAVENGGSSGGFRVITTTAQSDPSTFGVAAAGQGGLATAFNGVVPPQQQQQQAMQQYMPSPLPPSSVASTHSTTIGGSFGGVVDAGVATGFPISNGGTVSDVSGGSGGKLVEPPSLVAVAGQQQQQPAPVFTIPTPSQNMFAPISGSQMLVSPAVVGLGAGATSAAPSVAAAAAGGGLISAGTPGVAVAAPLPFPISSFLQLNPLYPGLRRLMETPPLYIVDDFFTGPECDALMTLGNDHMVISPVVGAGAGEISESRTSSSCFLAREDLPTVCSKVMALTGKPIEHLELPQVGRYYTSQKYANHWDAFDLSTEDGRRFAENGGQRVCTVLVYLNDVASGGCTSFPRLGLSVQPKKGMAVVFFPATLDGTLDPMLLHAAEPAIDTKWVSQIWIRQGSYHGTPSARIPRI